MAIHKTEIAIALSLDSNDITANFATVNVRKYMSFKYFIKLLIVVYDIKISDNTQSHTLFYYF